MVAEQELQYSVHDRGGAESGGGQGPDLPGECQEKYDLCALESVITCCSTPQCQHAEMIIKGSNNGVFWRWRRCWHTVKSLRKPCRSLAKELIEMENAKHPDSGKNIYSIQTTAAI